MLNRGEAGARGAAEGLRRGRRALFKNVRAIFGGNVRHATSGAAPIAREILEFFWACGVPVLEGYGMTETATAATISTVENHRFGTVGRALPGVELKIADDGEILIKGPNIFQRLPQPRRRGFGAVEDGWLHTGDLGSIDEDGYLSITGPQEGHHHHRRRQEPDAGQHRERPQAVPLDLTGRDARRPAPLPGRADHARRGRDAGVRRASTACRRTSPRSAASPPCCELIQAEVDRVNAKYAQVEQVKKFAILDHDLSQATGELTPTLKVKRNVVNEKYAEHVRRAVRAAERRRCAASCEHRDDAHRSNRQRRPVRRAPARHRAGALPPLPERGSERASASTARSPGDWSPR